MSPKSQRRREAHGEGAPKPGGQTEAWLGHSSVPWGASFKLNSCDSER